ncbi:hypothetical protein [Streptomyces reniochalinae]|uniref:Uncharacterized protein n=1 Tax=Streptomyces reniochalinae TaxID=2250578 RepID=A0A367F1U0_9ACTN|nr:hypothetical protein [Streptomyces reniochalinae]RCG23909.1 hypothetical protein DQ392_04335 [Streptomyces reniochalinae]
MNDHDHQTETERQRMLRRAEELSRKRGQLHLPHSPGDLPDLTRSSTHLADLASLVQDLSQEVRVRSAGSQPDPGLAAVVGAWARAAGHLSEAVGHYGAAYRQFGFLHAHSRTTPEHAALLNGRHTAFALAQRHIADTRDGLSSAHASMMNGAALLEDAEASSVSHAARARSAQADHARDQASAEAETPAEAPAQQPSHAAGPVRGR